MRKGFTPKVLLMRGRGPVGALVRCFTRSPYAHCAVLIDEGLAIESWHMGGVAYKQMKDWTDVTVFEVPDMTATGWQRSIKFLRAQVGKDYDWGGVIRFVTRRKNPDDDTWFCSELVSAALATGGVRLFERIEHSEISPGLLACSPLLTPSPWKP